MVRLFNLAEDKTLKVPIYTNNGWKIDDFGLHLEFKDIQESYANGIVIGARKVWNKIEGEINTFKVGS